MYLTVLFLLIGIVNASKSSTECLLGDLQNHDLIQCSNPSEPDSLSELETREENTTCFTIREDVVHHFTCIDGSWKDSSLNNYQDLNKLNGKRAFTAHPTRVKRGFWGSVGRFFAGIGRAVVCVATLFLACSTGGRAGPPPDRTPPTIYDCPPPIYAVAKPFQTYAVVTWREPTATDNKDGNVTPIRYGSGPHYSFSEERSPHIITYVAKDHSGNRAECKVKITITVIRCPKINRIANGWYICHPSTDYVLEGSCRFGCYEGFELDGAAHITCTNRSMWSDNPPKCKPLTCPVLSPIEGASPSCTEENHFRSICSFNCKVGYDMPSHVSKALVCQNDKTWRKNGEPKCKDIEAPSFKTCPSVVITGTEVGRTKGRLVWKEPVVADNSGQTITAKQSSGSAKFGSYQTAGTYAISYSAADAEGNRARDCKFKVVIRDTRCPRLYPTPYMQISCPNGYRTGAICNISCDPGKVIVGNPDVRCEEAAGGLLGSWNWGRQRTICNGNIEYDTNLEQWFFPNGSDQYQCWKSPFQKLRDERVYNSLLASVVTDVKEQVCSDFATNNCVHLKPPKNGALACDNWLGGEFCQYQCKKNYDSFTDWKKLTVCQKSGTWKPHIDSFNCVHQYTGRRPHQTHVAIKAEYFFSGDCSNATTKAEIRQHFINALKSSLWSDVCLAEPNCNVGNVQVFCGPSEQSRHRRAATGFDHGYANNSSNTASTVTLEATLQMEAAPNQSFVEIQTKYVDVLSRMETSFENIVKDDSLTSFNTSFIEVTNNGLKLACPDGSVEARNSFTCILCPEGSHFDKNSKSCLPCSKSTYQDGLGQLQCKKCPLGTTTRGTGSSAYSDCEDACEPGTYSLDGIVPCSPCEVGYYQNLYGQSNCKRCKGSKSTVSIGSTLKTDCYEFDIEFPKGNPKSVSLQLQKDIKFTNFYISFWTHTNNISGTSLDVSLLDTNGLSVFTFQDIRQLAIGQPRTVLDSNLFLPDERWHKVLISIQQCNVTVSLDGRASFQTPLSKICGKTMFVNTVQVDADEDFAGGISQLNIGTSVQSVVAAEERCFHGDIADLLSWHEFGGANMTGAFINFPSACDDFDNCLSSPCYHGLCKDAIDSFVCECHDGFTGSQCETNIDDCGMNICLNNATCIDGVQSYTCACAGNETGKYCEIEMVHGEWGTWGNWSECSTTCGDGEHMRVRLCDSPAPDNGGSECVGEMTDTIPCNSTDCPSCSEMLAPENGTLTCTNSSGSLNCTIACNDGFDFDIAPLDYYFCGQDTFHEWNFQTSINPLRRLPKCTEISMPRHLSVQYSARYKDLYCSRGITETIKHTIFNQLHGVLTNVPCIKRHICSLERVEILHCGSQRRQKRQQETIGFQLTVSTTPDEVPCGEGAYLYTDYCTKCDIGYYQPAIGQSSCLQCPEDRTTLGVGSTTIDDCSVHLDPKPDTLEITAIALGSSFAAAAVMMVIVLIYRRKSALRKKKNFLKIQPERTESSLSIGTNPTTSAIAPIEDNVGDVITLNKTHASGLTKGKTRTDTNTDSSQTDGFASLSMFGLGIKKPPHHVTRVRDKLEESLQTTKHHDTKYKNMDTTNDDDSITLYSAMGIMLVERPSSRMTDITI